MVSAKKAKPVEQMKMEIMNGVGDAIMTAKATKDPRSCLLVLDDIEKVIKENRSTFCAAMRGLQRHVLPHVHLLIIQEASIRGGLLPGLEGEEVITLRRQAWPFDLLGTPDGLDVPERYAQGLPRAKKLPGEI